MKIVMGNRLEDLADRLVRSLREHPPADPLEPEHVLTQTEGMAHWVTLRVAAGCDSAAHLRFLTPERLLDHLAAALEPLPEGPSPFDPHLLPWAVAGALPDAAGASGEAGETLRLYLGGGTTAPGSESRRFQLAARVADLFDQYTVYRPDVLEAWESGRTTGDDGGHEVWQAALWREVRRRAADAVPRHLRARRVIERLRASPPGAVPGLPGRLSAIGVSTLPPLFVELLDALGRHLPVTAHLLNPSRDYWLDLLTPPERRRLIRRNAGEDEALLHLEAGNPLLASLGRTTRDFLGLLPHDALFDQSAECWADPAGEAPAPLLAALQADILENRRPDGGAGPALPGPGCAGSLRLAVCRSPRREVEVLHDHLLRLFEETAGLEPRDVVVMTPDVEIFAPLVEAVFGASALPGAPGEPVGDAGGNSPHLPFTLADRPVRKENAVAEALGDFLEAAEGRLDLPAVWDLFELVPVQARFPVAEEARARLRERLAQTGVRWGLDGAFKKDRFGVPDDPAHTWRFGLDRLMLGWVMGGSSGPGAETPSPEEGGPPMFAGILPDDRAAGLDAGALGAFVEFMSRLEGFVEAVRTPRTLAAWAAFLREGLLGAFFDPDPAGESAAWVDEEIDRLAEGETVAGFREAIPFPVLRDHFRGALNAVVSTAGYLRGGITFCTLKPLRSVPFRVVCLLGMDHDAFPRRTPAPGFNLAAARPRPGDRDPRETDRHLFFETLLSARDHLYVSWTGFGVSDGRERLPSSVVSELIDTLRLYLPGPPADAAVEGYAALPPSVCTVHPLHPFSRAYFDGSDPELFSYSAENLEAARAEGCTRGQPTGRKDPGEPASPGTFHRFAPLPSPDPALLGPDVVRFARFFKDPCAFLLRERLGTRLEEAEEERLEEEPFSLGRLGKYQVQEEILSTLRSGSGFRSDLLRAAGKLPPGGPGTIEGRELHREADAMFLRFAEVAGASPGSAPETVPVDLRGLGAEGRVSVGGFVDGVWGRRRVVCRPSKAHGETLAELWVHHLALCCREAADESHYIGPGGEGFSLAAVGGDEARERLSDLADLYLEGLRRAVPFFAKPAWEYVKGLRANGPDDFPGLGSDEDLRALGGASREWYANFINQPPTGIWTYRPALRLVFRDGGTGLLDPDREPETANEFRVLARRFFGPVLPLLAGKKAAGKGGKS
ncbi:MAG: exodeoxyribonuclease V subunit gamma [Acidobacteria bacterium]|nr:exodeoxyribonuclease V subunit gamma [Acidobacteriota bacterium]